MKIDIGKQSTSSILIDFIISILKSLVIPAIWLALSVMNSQITCSKSRHSGSKSHHFCFINRTIFALSRIISVSNTKRDVKAFLFPLFNKLASWSVKYILVLPEFWDFKMAVGNWTSCRAILVWNHTCDFKSNSHCALIRFWRHSYYFRPNCTPLSSITIIYYIHFEITRLQWSVQSDWLSAVWFIPKSRSFNYHYLLSGFIMFHMLQHFLPLLQQYFFPYYKLCLS